MHRPLRQDKDTRQQVLSQAGADPSFDQAHAACKLKSMHSQLLYISVPFYFHATRPDDTEIVGGAAWRGLQ